jgi:hypothetical protein
VANLSPDCGIKELEILNIEKARNMEYGKVEYLEYKNGRILEHN